MISQNMKNKKLLGALAGDNIGSVYEFQNTKSMDFEKSKTNSLTSLERGNSKALRQSLIIENRPQ